MNGPTISRSTMKRSRWLLTAAAAIAVAACTSAPLPTPEPPVTKPAPPSTPPTPTLANSTNREPTQSARLENGLLVRSGRSSEGRDALLQVGVFGGTLLQAPGLAELTAQVVAESADPAQGRGSLRQAIQQLGGTLHVQLGPVTTWFEARVPADRWRDAAAALRAAMVAPTQSRSQVERIRELLLQQCRSEVQRDPVEAQAQQLLLGERSSAEHMLGLLDRDPSEVSLFHARQYRPENMVLAVEVPVPADQVLTALKKGSGIDFGGWNPPPAPGQPSLLDRRFESGAYWAADDGTTCRVALVMLLPEPCTSSAPLFVLQDCLTLDGTGGRLEQMQRERGLDGVRWRSSLVHSADAVALVLQAELSANQAAVAWRTLQLARSSLLDVPPNASELALARRRAPLTARLGLLEGGARLRTSMRLSATGETIGDLDLRLDELDRTGRLVPEGAVETFLKQPVAMVVVGGRPPADLDGVRPLELLPAGFTTPKAPAGEPAPTQRSAAAPWLDRAMEAAGGAELLRRLIGWNSEAALEHDRAPTVVETTTWQDDGTLQRQRQLLGQTITTTLKGDAWTETLEAETHTLAPSEAQALRREQARHPLALLAAHARGELQFDVIAKRTVGDRDHIVLQASGERLGRLRLHVDTESHLVRLVEVWDSMPDGSIVHVEEAWSDYRQSRGVRAPFLRQTSQDDGRNRLTTTFRSWTPTLRR